jgi:nucleotide-binding universal stress UspA family protein
MKNTFKNILVPYNGTDGSQKAFDKAVGLASPIHANITIFTCVEKRSTFSFFKSKTKNDEYEKERKTVETQHMKMKTFANKNKVECNSQIVQGNYASEEILSFADQHNIDLIIMSKTKFTSHKERMHYQSTLENVFRNAHCPILILN